MNFREIGLTGHKLIEAEEWDNVLSMRISQNNTSKYTTKRNGSNSNQCICNVLHHSALKSVEKWAERS